MISFLNQFAGKDQLIKKQGQDDQAWEREIGPQLLALQKLGLVTVRYANEVSYPVIGILTEAGVKQRDLLLG